MVPGPVSLVPVSFGLDGIHGPLSGPPALPQDSSFFDSGPSVLVHVPVLKGHFTVFVVQSSGRPRIRVAALKSLQGRASVVSSESSLAGNSPPMVFVGFARKDFSVSTVIVSFSF